MTKDEALRLALEALEDLGMKHHENTGEVLYKETFTAIKAALEAKDEPDHSDELTIAYMSGLHRGKEVAQRTWVGLTDEERDGKRVLENGLLFNTAEVQIWEMAVEWAEQKLKEKNT